MIACVKLTKTNQDKQPCEDGGRLELGYHQSRAHQKLGETREGHRFGPAETLIWSPDTNNKILITSVHQGVANGPLELMHPPKSEPRVYFVPVNYKSRCSIWTNPECHTGCLIAFLCSACTLNLELMSTPCCFSFDAGDGAFIALCMALCMVKLDAAYRGSSKSQSVSHSLLPLKTAWLPLFIFSFFTYRSILLTSLDVRDH